MRRLLFIAVVLGPLAVPAPAAAGWIWPVDGEVITRYRNGDDPYARGQHRGIDIAAPAGTPVRAPARGEVTFSGTAGSSGLTVSLRTADGRLDTSYLYLSSASVRKGDHVEAGARLGAVGTSGLRSATQPHLHFGVREAGSRHGYRDPLTLLPAPPTRPVREAPRAVPVAAPAPVRVAPWPERAPRAAPVRRRVPAGRRPRVPAARRSPRGAPSRPTLAPRPVTPLVAPGRSPRRTTEPGLGPQPVATPAPRLAPAVEPRAAPSEASATGPDLGMVLACLGLLLAAACVGGRAAGNDQRARALRGLRLLSGRR